MSLLRTSLRRGLLPRGFSIRCNRSLRRRARPEDHARARPPSRAEERRPSNAAEKLGRRTIYRHSHRLLLSGPQGAGK